RSQPFALLSNAFGVKKSAKHLAISLRSLAGEMPSAFHSSGSPNIAATAPLGTKPVLKRGGFWRKCDDSKHPSFVPHPVITRASFRGRVPRADFGRRPCSP